VGDAGRAAAAAGGGVAAAAAGGGVVVVAAAGASVRPGTRVIRTKNEADRKARRSIFMLNLSRLNHGIDL